MSFNRTKGKKFALKSNETQFKYCYLSKIATLQFLNAGMFSYALLAPHKRTAKSLHAKLPHCH